MPIDCKSAWEREAVDDPGNLSLALKLGKSRYRLREVIFATLILKNISSVPIWVNNRMVVNRYNEFLQDYGEVYFVLVSRDGRSALFGAQVNADEAEKKYFIELQPNKQLETVSEGIMYYSFGGDGNTGLSEGKYCVWTVYHNQTDPTVNGQVWKGKIKSNMVEFEITK
jgi:hypothetical protein